MMTSKMEQDEAYWSYISTMTQACGSDTIKDIFRDGFDLIRSHLDELFWVESNCLYLNLVCGVSQVRIAKMIGISQLGVSKRVRAGIRKLKNVLIKPEKDSDIIRNDFIQMVSEYLVETIIIYYNVKMFSVVSRILGNITEGAVRIRVLNAIEQIRKISKCKDIDSMCKVIKSINPRDSKNIIFNLKSDSSKFESMLVMSNRYIVYLDAILFDLYSSDFMFKKFDKDRRESNNES